MRRKEGVMRSEKGVTRCDEGVRRYKEADVRCEEGVRSHKENACSRLTRVDSETRRLKEQLARHLPVRRPLHPPRNLT